MQLPSFPFGCYTNPGTVEGLALRSLDDTVHFQTTRTGAWTTLTNADAPALHLHGRCDLADTQALLDGNLLVKASQTLQGVAR